MIPEPRDSTLDWALDNPDAARQAVRTLNNITVRLQVKLVASGGSSLTVGPDNAILTISTRDIHLGTLTGSKASNAALTSLIAALKSVFTVSDSTT